MPSTRPDTGLSRRRALAGLGAVVAGGLAGCGGRLSGTGPAELDATATVERDQDPRILWQYPPRDGDADGIGYAAVEADRVVQREGQASVVRLNFNSTVGGLAASEPYRGYHPDWFRFRVWPPTTYEGRLSHQVRVEPPGQWEGFATYYDVHSNVRRTTVELRDIDTQGTITVPAVFDVGSNSLPDRLHCSFAVQASRSGVLGKTVRVAEQGVLPLGEEAAALLAKRPRGVGRVFEE